MNTLKKKRENEILNLVNDLSKNFSNTPLDVVRLANNNGFKVFQLKKGVDLGGLIVVFQPENNINNEKIIAYRNDMEEKDNRFIIAHELGHYFLHSKDPLYANNNSYVYAYHVDNESKNKTGEIEADFFATNLLVPKDLFEKKCEELGDLAQTEFGIEVLSEYFNVNKKCIKKRLGEVYGRKTSSSVC